MLSFRHKKQTSKNAADTTFKVNDNSTNLAMFNLILSLNIQQEKKFGESPLDGCGIVNGNMNLPEIRGRWGI